MNSRREMEELTNGIIYVAHEAILLYFCTHPPTGGELPIVRVSVEGGLKIGDLQALSEALSRSMKENELTLREIWGSVYRQALFHPYPSYLENRPTETPRPDRISDRIFAVSVHGKRMNVTDGVPAWQQ